jgi:hypothetical protein
MAGHDRSEWSVTKARNTHQDLIDEAKAGIPSIDPIASKQGPYGGTFVVKELVYVYALYGSLRASILHMATPASPCSVAPASAQKL